MKVASVIRRRLGRKEPVRMDFDYAADCLAVSMRQIGFLNDERFVWAWEQAAEANRGGWGSDEPPDIRWHAHFACWAATHGLNLEGDFVECGVHTGLLSLTICHYLDFPNVPKNFYLFDTFEGIPRDRIAYLSIDLNNAVGEIASIEALWNLLVPGAIVLLDDYEWAYHEPQQLAWNEFAASRRHSIACLPTGQGMLIKH